MNVLKTWYQPIAEVEFTWSEVEGLILFSEMHYDHKCKELSQSGGILVEMRNRFDFPLRLGTENDSAMRRSAKIAVRLNGYEADLLAKTAESDPAMGRKLAEISRHINSEWRKINKENL